MLTTAYPIHNLEMNMKNTNVDQAVESLKNYQPTSGFKAWCYLDDNGYDMDAVFADAVAGYEEATGAKLPVATYVYGGKPKAEKQA